MTPADWASIGIGGVAVLLALFAYVSNRSFQTREGLGRLLESYERASFHVLMWRVEQLTRLPAPAGKSWSLEPVSTTALYERWAAEKYADRRRLLDQALASDWSVQEAHMHNVYFFALRTQAWIAAGWLRRRRARLLNSTLGYSFVSTLLDHHIVALRLRRKDQPESYFATFYGLFDPEYSKLMQRLTRDILRKRRKLPPPIRKVVALKRTAIDERLGVLSPEDSAMLASAEDVGT